jgi:hypothetical protein
MQGIEPARIEPPLVDNPNVQVVYADGPCSVEAHGHVVRITYFEYRMEGGREVRMPVLTMVRPIESALRSTVSVMLREALERLKLAAVH